MNEPVFHGPMFDAGGLTAELTTMKSENDALRRELARVTKERDAAEEERVELRGRVAEMRVMAEGGAAMQRHANELKRAAEANLAAMTQDCYALRRELARVRKELDSQRQGNEQLRRELAGFNKDQPATPEEIHAACLAYNHGYGLLHWEQQGKIACEAVEWRDAWRKAAKAGKDSNK